MSIPAVTEASSAEANSSEREASSHFLPTDKNYRLTGELPEEELEVAGTQVDKGEHIPAGLKEEQEKEKQQSATPGDKGDDAAASSAATTQEQQTKEQQSGTQKTAAASESRWAKITRENRELRERLARVEGRQEAQPQPRETQQTSQTAADAKKGRLEPKADDVDAKTGKPKYTTYDDYSKDLRAWDREQALLEFQTTSEKTAREQAFKQAKETIASKWGEEVKTARTKHDDFDAVALNPDLPLKEGSVPDVFILDSPHGTEVLYYLGANPEELTRINKLNPISQARELTKIELKVSGQQTQAAPVKKITAAPPPPRQVSGSGTVQKDATQQAVEDGDAEAYIRAENAKALARLKKGK